MKDYHDLYLKCDVLLLADVFQEFRNSSLKNHELCLSYYFGAPALSWHECLMWQRWSLNLFQMHTSIYS